MTSTPPDPPEPLHDALDGAGEVDTDLTAVVAALQDQLDQLRATVTAQQRDLNALRAEVRHLQSRPQG